MVSVLLGQDAEHLLALQACTVNGCQLEIIVTQPDAWEFWPWAVVEVEPMEGSTAAINALQLYQTQYKQYTQAAYNAGLSPSDALGRAYERSVPYEERMANYKQQVCGHMVRLTPQKCVCHYPCMTADHAALQLSTCAPFRNSPFQWLELAAMCTTSTGWLVGGMESHCVTYYGLHQDNTYIILTTSAEIMISTFFPSICTVSSRLCGSVGSLCNVPCSTMTTENEFSTHVFHDQRAHNVAVVTACVSCYVCSQVQPAGGCCRQYNKLGSTTNKLLFLQLLHIPHSSSYRGSNQPRDLSATVGTSAKHGCYVLMMDAAEL